MKRPEIVARIHDVVKTLPSDFKVWLYGSEARGDARADSDVDILILRDGDRLTPLQQQQLFQPLYNIELETGVQINPHFETQEQWNSRKSMFTINVNKERVAL